jgi:hypothetical protein
MNPEDLSPIERTLRRRLDAAVPALPEPPDRVAAVRGRVRRSRRNDAVAVGAAAVLVLLGSAGLAARAQSGPPAGRPVVAGDCPPLLPAASSRRPDQPGDLVPPGAIAVTRCETAPPAPTPPTEGPARPGIAPRTLTTGVEDIVRAANALPPVPLGQQCTLVGQPTEISLVFRYPDGHALTVVADRNCGTLTTGEHTRAGLGPLYLFDSLAR